MNKICTTIEQSKKLIETNLSEDFVDACVEMIIKLKENNLI